MRENSFENRKSLVTVSSHEFESGINYNFKIGEILFGYSEKDLEIVGDGNLENGIEMVRAALESDPDKFSITGPVAEKGMPLRPFYEKIDAQKKQSRKRH